MKDIKLLSNKELSSEILKQTRFIRENVSGQRYGVFGSPYIDTSLFEEAATRLENNDQR